MSAPQSDFITYNPGGDSEYDNILGPSITILSAASYKDGASNGIRGSSSTACDGDAQLSDWYFQRILVENIKANIDKQSQNSQPQHDVSAEGGDPKTDKDEGTNKKPGNSFITGALVGLAVCICGFELGKCVCRHRKRKLEQTGAMVEKRCDCSCHRVRDVEKALAEKRCECSCYL